MREYVQSILDLSVVKFNIFSATAKCNWINNKSRGFLVILAALSFKIVSIKNPTPGRLH